MAAAERSPPITNIEDMPLPPVFGDPLLGARTKGILEVVALVTFAGSSEALVVVVVVVVTVVVVVVITGEL